MIDQEDFHIKTSVRSPQRGQLCKQLYKTNSRQNDSEHDILQRNLLTVMFTLTVVMRHQEQNLKFRFFFLEKSMYCMPI